MLEETWPHHSVGSAITATKLPLPAPFQKWRWRWRWV